MDAMKLYFINHRVTPQVSVSTVTLTGVRTAPWCLHCKRYNTNDMNLLMELERAPLGLLVSKIYAAIGVDLL